MELSENRFVVNPQVANSPTVISSILISHPQYSNGSLGLIDYDPPLCWFHGEAWGPLIMPNAVLPFSVAD